MNTKTMRLPPRRVLTPTKRKERDDLDAPTPKLSSFTKLPKPIASQPGFDKAAKPDSSNQLLAGYLAHEYLTKGTLFGQPFDPVPAAQSTEPDQGKKEEAEPNRGAEPQGEKYQRYVEVASLLKTNGAHISGIVNPTLLARFLQM
ncbi:hypothetical protein ACOSQ3_001313 [Xanthoceras sorbifolium]